MFERFSDGYYLGRLYVKPTTEAQAQMCAAQHERVNEQLYDENEVTARPLVMKLGTHHLAVHGDERVPADTLSVPESVLSETTVWNPPTLQEVLLAEAERANQLLGLGGVDA